MTPIYNHRADASGHTALFNNAMILPEMEQLDQVCNSIYNAPLLHRIIHFTICQSPDALWALDVTLLLHLMMLHTFLLTLNELVACH